MELAGWGSWRYCRLHPKVVSWDKAGWDKVDLTDPQRRDAPVPGKALHSKVAF